MSLRATSIVLERSRHPGTSKLVLLAIADNADENGERCHPSMDTIARKANCSHRRATDLVAALEGDGTLQVQRGAGPNGTNVYSLRKWLDYQEQMAAQEKRERAAMGLAGKQVGQGGKSEVGGRRSGEQAQRSEVGGRGSDKANGELGIGVDNVDPAIIAGVKTLQGEIGERPIAGEGVKSSASGFPTNSQEQSLTVRNEGGARAASPGGKTADSEIGAPGGGALAHAAEVGSRRSEVGWQGDWPLPDDWRVVPELAEACERWRQHLAGVQKAWSPQTWRGFFTEAEGLGKMPGLTGHRASEGDDGFAHLANMVIRVLDFSMCRGAKQPIFAEAINLRKYVPKVLRLVPVAEAADSTSVILGDRGFIIYLEGQYGPKAKERYERATPDVRANLARDYQQAKQASKAVHGATGSEVAA